MKIEEILGMNEKELIEFGFDNNEKHTDIVNSEMMRRMKISIDNFNKQSSKQTDTLIKLTWWIIGLTIALGVIALFQLIIILRGG